LNAVVDDPSGRPAAVVCARGQGTLAADGRTLSASGASEVYRPSGELLTTNHAELVATRADVAPERE
jgi:hypothetical protein